ncbi:MAG: hypothetical protein K2X41_00585 [Hyphomicrobium sp.]|nr:hypothetical protein [Hyphomicrobium sp.]
MSTRLFRLIWRFNALSIAVVSMLGLVIGLFGTYQIARDLFRPNRASDTARVAPLDGSGKMTGDPPGVETDLELSTFTRIRGTPILASQLTATQSYDFRYSSKQAGSRRNVVFYDTASGRSRKLLPDNARLIIDAQELRGDTDNNDAAPRALFYRLIEADSTGDGVLNGDDRATAALARADGQGLTRLDTVAGDYLGNAVIGDGATLILMVGDAKAAKAVHVDLATFKILRSEDVVR